MDKPAANRHVAMLVNRDAVSAERCHRLDPDAIRSHTDFHWRPRPVQPSWSTRILYDPCNTLFPSASSIA